MSLKKTLVQISASLGIAALLVLSLRGPDRGNRGLSILMEPDGTGVWRDLIDRFERLHPETHVQLIEGPAATDSREDMYSTSFLSGASSYDIVYGDVTWTPEFAAAGWLLDLTDRLSPGDAADFFPADFRAGFYQNRLYRIPAFTDAGILYYRKDLVPRPPVTFDDLERLAGEFRSADRSGFLWQGKQFEGLVTVFLEVLWGFGGDWIDVNTGEVLLDRPEALQALQFLVRSVGTISPAAVTTYTEEDTRVLFQNGRGVFLRNWPYVWTVMSGSSMMAEGRVGMTSVVHAPGFPSSATLGGWGFAISKFTRDPAAAWRFVEFLTRPEQLLKVRDRFGRIPARQSLVQPEFVSILNSARPRPLIPQYARASDILQRWLSAAITRQIDPADALKKAAAETRTLLGT